MAIRKFGTSEKVLKDEKDKQGISKESSTQWTEKDAQELQEEINKPS